MKFLDIKTLVAIVSVTLLLNACGTTAHRIDPDSNNSLITVGDINVKDWQIAAQKGINSLLASGVLNRDDGRKTIVMVSTVKNSTNLSFSKTPTRFSPGMSFTIILRFIM